VTRDRKWKDGIMEKWKGGMVEEWKAGVLNYLL
jgi:hypothetical protein